MVFLMPYPILTFWIDAALVLFAILVVVAFTQYTPGLRSQIQLAERGEISSAEYVRLNGRNRISGSALGVLVLLILVLMVFKPHL